MANMVIQAKAQDVNFVTKFEDDLHNLLAILGKEEVEVMAPGTAFKIYASSGTLSNETVDEKELIPDSNIAMGDATIKELTFEKFRNLVGIESVAKKGYEVAVGGANTEIRKQIAKKVRKSIIDGLNADGATVIDATGLTFQAKVAKCAGKVQEKYEDEACTPVFFANTSDAYDYLGSANIGLAQNYGLSYIENFVGIGNVIIDSNVPAGTIYGTALENLKVLAADVTNIDGMELTTDVAGLVAVHNGAKYENGALETVVYSGLAVFPAIADRIVKAAEEEESE